MASWTDYAGLPRLLIVVADAGILLWGATAALGPGHRNTITFGAAMTYDRTVNAIGPFELSEYLGLAVIYAALVVTTPFIAAGRRGGRAT